MSAAPGLKVNPPLGQLPVLQYCAPDQLKIDEDYQRSLQAKGSQGLIRRIAVNWDWSLCQPLIVARRADGGLYVVDGQHRLAAARLRGDIWQLPCVVASYRDAAEEAASFVALNQQRRPLNKLQLFRAAVAAGDATALAVKAGLEAAGMWIGTSADLSVQQPGAMTCVAALEACCRMRGAATLNAALDVLGRAYPGQQLRYAGTIFPGIAAIVADEIAVDRAFPMGERIRLMITMVGRARQEDWYKRLFAAIAADSNLKRSRAAIKVFAAAWADYAAAPVRRPAAQPVSPPIAARPIAVPPQAEAPQRPSPFKKGKAASVQPARWCDQCEQRVAPTQVEACPSPFCKAKAAAA